MRIVLHDFGGYSFTAQLGRELALRRHEVLYLRSAGFRAERDAPDYTRGAPLSLTMESIGIGRKARSALSPARLGDERRYGQVLARRIAQFPAEVVISANCPLDAQAAAQRQARSNGAAFVYWLQDIYSEAVSRILARRLPLAGDWIGKRFAHLERRMLRASDAVVPISPDYLPFLERWGIPPERITMIENWAPLNEVQPRPKENGWSAEQGLVGSDVLLYAGTLGRKHDPSLLLALADALPGAVVVVIAEGAGMDWLRRHGATRENVRLLPYQPSSSLSDVLGAADVLVALLEEDASVFSVPSKVLTYLAAGRPILAAIPPENHAARTITRLNAGRVVPPSMADELVGAAREMLADPEERKRAAAAGRAYAERTFDIGRVADSFDRVLSSVRPIMGVT
jgi:colanic acid biosynthesis glycosyl transferase WcaI